MVDLRTGQSLTAGAQSFNDALRDVASKHDRVSIIDWNSVVESTLDDSEPPVSTLTKDSIHPTAEGNRRLNDLYDTALSDC
jgi:hypothetical protein